MWALPAGDSSVSVSPSQLPAQLEVLKASSYDDYLALVSVAPTSGQPQLEKRFSDGNTFWCLAQDDEVLSSGWVALQVASFPLGEIRRRVSFDPPVTVLFDFQTAPAHRGRGLYRTLLEQIKHAYAQDTCYIYASTKNHPSLRAIERSGFRKVTTVHPWTPSMRFRETDVNVDRNAP